MPPSAAMPQTNPFHFLAPKKLSDSELASAIRLDMEAELDAINLYQAHLEATENAEAQAILRHIMDEEREHAALFTELVKRLDPKYREHVGEASAKYQLIVTGASHEAVEAVGKEGTEGVSPGLPGLTVGALRTREVKER
jgi:uncharacterized protein